MILQRPGVLFVVAVVLATMPGCAAIAGIFKAGMGVGIILSILVVGLIFFIVSKARA